MDPATYGLWSLWLGSFAAHTDAYVVDSNRTVTEALTPRTCEEALASGHALSGFLARQEGDGFTSIVGAIDVDTTVDDALAIRKVLSDHKVQTLMALSRRGAHLWTWTEGDGTDGTEKYMPVGASIIRKGLLAAVTLAIADPDVRSHIEVFPKRSGSPFGVGALRMPLFKHPKTGIVYPVIDAEGHETLDRQQAYDWAVATQTPLEALRRLAGSQVAHVTYPTDIGRLRAPTTLPEGPGVVSILSRMGVHPAPVPGRNVRCPFHEDRHASLSIAKDDARVWCKAPTCPAYNGGRGVGSLALAKMVRPPA